MREQLESRKYIPLWTQSSITILQVKRKYEEKIKLLEIERQQLKEQSIRECEVIKTVLRKELEIEYQQFKKEKVSYNDEIAKLQNLDEPPKY